MKSTLTHRVSTILAATLATAALATGAASAAPLTLDPVATPTDSAPIADLVVPIPTGSAALDLGEAVISAGSNQLITGSAVMSGSSQISCKMQGGTWIQGDSDHYSYCHIGFNPSSLTIDPAPPTAEPAATTTGSGWSASSNVPYLNSILCQFLGQGRYWRSDYGCTNVPPFVS